MPLSKPALYVFNCLYYSLTFLFWFTHPFQNLMKAMKLSNRQPRIYTKSNIILEGLQTPKVHTWLKIPGVQSYVSVKTLNFLLLSDILKNIFKTNT